MALPLTKRLGGALAKGGRGPVGRHGRGRRSGTFFDPKGGNDPLATIREAVNRRPRCASPSLNVESTTLLNLEALRSVITATKPEADPHQQRPLQSDP